MIELKNAKDVKIFDDIEIYHYYLGDFNVGECMLSPLRIESNPSFCIFYHNEGRLYWKDFGTGLFGDSIEFVKRMFGLTYGAAVKKIELDVQAGFSSFIGLPNKIKRTTDIQIKRRDFSILDLNYWLDYGITKEILDKFKVFSISNYWLNDKVFYIPRNKLTFAYQFVTKFKIYQPYDKYNWISNCTSTVLQGIDSDSDLLILSKSHKDCMTYYSMGYSARAPQSESILLSKEIIDYLKGKHKRIIVNFDNDEAGLQAMRIYNEKYGFETFSVPKIEGIKDIADFRKYHSEEQTKQLINEKIKK